MASNCVMAPEHECIEADGEFSGVGVACADVECESCQADLNGNGSVEVLDIIELISAWGACP